MKPCINEHSSFEDLLKSWRRSPANLGIATSLSFYQNWGDTMSDNQFYKAEKVLFRKHKQAFLAWLKLQQ